MTALPVASSPLVAREVVSRRRRLVDLCANVARALSIIAGIVACVLFPCGHFFFFGPILAVALLSRELVAHVARVISHRSDVGHLLDAVVGRYEELFAFGGLTLFFRCNAVLVASSLFALMGLLLIGYGGAKADALRVKIPAMRLGQVARTATCVVAALAPTLNTLWRHAGTYRTVTQPTLLVVVVLAIVVNVVAIRRLRRVAALTSKKTINPVDTACEEGAGPTLDGSSQAHVAALDESTASIERCRPR